MMVDTIAAITTFAILATLAAGGFWLAGVLFWKMIKDEDL